MFIIIYSLRVHESCPRFYRYNIDTIYNGTGLDNFYWVGPTIFGHRIVFHDLLPTKSSRSAASLILPLGARAIFRAVTYGLQRVFENNCNTLNTARSAPGRIEFKAHPDPPLATRQYKFTTFDTAVSTPRMCIIIIIYYIYLWRSLKTIYHRHGVCTRQR